MTGPRTKRTKAGRIKGRRPSGATEATPVRQNSGPASSLRTRLVAAVYSVTRAHVRKLERWPAGVGHDRRARELKATAARIRALVSAGCGHSSTLSAARRMYADLEQVAACGPGAGRPLARACRDAVFAILSGGRALMCPGRPAAHSFDAGSKISTADLVWVERYRLLVKVNGHTKAADSVSTEIARTRNIEVQSARRRLLRIVKTKTHGSQ